MNFAKMTNKISTIMKSILSSQYQVIRNVTSAHSIWSLIIMHRKSPCC